MDSQQGRRSDFLDGFTKMKSLFHWLSVFLIATALFATTPQLSATELRVDDLVRVSTSGLTFNRRSNTFDTRVNIVNISTGSVVFGPLSLVVSDISNPQVSLENTAGTTLEGHPSLSLPVPPGGLYPGARIVGPILKFRNPMRGKFSFRSAVVTENPVKHLKLVASEVVGAGGRTIHVTDINSPIYRASVNIPPGALAKNVRISIAELEPPELPVDFRAAGPAAAFLPDGIEFRQPVTISLPTSDSVGSLIYLLSGDKRPEVEIGAAGDDSAESANQYFSEPGQQIAVRTRHFSNRQPLTVASVRAALNLPFTPGVPVEIIRENPVSPLPIGHRDRCSFNVRSTIRRIIVHSTNDALTLEREIGVALSANFMAHYYIDRSGQTVQVVRENIKTCHTSGYNDDSIGIELLDHHSSGPYAPYSSDQMQALVKLTQNIMDRYQIPVDKVFRHKDFSGDPLHQDPYAWRTDPAGWVDFTKRLCEPNTSPCVLLTVTNNGLPGSGGIASVPAGIQCNPRCEARFSKGSSVTLTAAAANGAVFSGWSGGGCAGSAPTCNVVLNSNTSIAADFDSGVGIHLVSARYGPSCDDSFSGGAPVDNLISCDGLNNCNIFVDNSVFDDPYYGCPKDFAVSWHCGNNPQVFSAYHEPVGNEGYTVSISCP